MDNNNKSSELIYILKNKVQERSDLTTVTDEELQSIIEETMYKMATPEYNIDEAIKSHIRSITYKEKNGIIRGTYNAIRGLDILGTIIEDKAITEIMINGYDNIFVEKAGRLQKLNQKFESPEKLKNIITKFVQAAGRSVTEANPIVDTRLEDGSRVNVVLPPVALNGPIVTIRRFPEKTMTVEELIERGSIPLEVANFLKDLVVAKYNIFVSGGTGSGKTTFLNALSNYIPRDERIITIEDSAELQIKNIDNLVRLETREVHVAGAQAINIRSLIKSALRMRPERIVVGEVRGPEALDMLQAMNTGHDGSLSTGHSNSPKDMISRLETMILSGADGLPLEAVRQQIASGIDIIIHLSRMRDHSRRTIEISEVVEYKDGQVVLNPLYVFKETGEATKDKVVGELCSTGNELVNKQKLIHAGIRR